MTKILFAGEGGQGVQVIAEILAKAAFKKGQSALYIPNFGVEQRGGISLAFVVINKKPIVYPKFEKADILAILSNRSIKRITSYIDSRTKIVSSPAVTPKKNSKVPSIKHLGIKHLEGVGNITPRVWNILVLGKVNRIGKIVSESSLIETMNKRFARQFERNPELKELDLKALKGEF